MLPTQAIIEFQRIYRKLYKKKISLRNATEQANKLINLVVLIEKPIKYEYENEKEAKRLHSNS